MQLQIIPENNVSTVIFGVVLPSSIEGIVWGDLDQDGIREENEEPTRNFVVELYSGQQLISQTYTDDFGRYQFLNIYPGAHYLGFSTQARVLFSPKDATLEAFDSDPFPETGFTEVFTVSSGQQESLWDAGIFLNNSYP